MKEFFTVENQDGERIDRYLSEELEDRSRSYIQKLIKENHVTVNQKPVKANYRLSLGDRVEIDLPEAKEPDINLRTFLWTSSMKTRISSLSISRSRWSCIQRPGTIARRWSML